MKLNSFYCFALTFALACKPVATVGPSTSGVPSTIYISPSNPEMEVADTLQFTATEPVAWSADAGTISTAGLYTAPSISGTYHVTATSTTTSGKTSNTPVKVRKTTVTISPNPATVVAGQTLQFSATVLGPSNTGATWSVQETTGCGSVSALGLYTAPPVGGVTCHVVATSVANTSKKATVAVSVTIPSGITLTITPNTAYLSPCQTQQFNSSVYGTTDNRVTWTIREGTVAGTITSTGLYTVAANSGNATYHVEARSVADPTVYDVAVVTVAVPTITLGWTVLEAGGGTISSGGVYTAPMTPGTYTVQATATATSGNIVSVTVSPPSVSLQVGQSQSFTATVATHCGSGVVPTSLVVFNTPFGVKGAYVNSKVKIPKTG